MPNIKSAKKRVIISEKKAARNTSAKSSLRTSVKKAKVAIANNDANTAVAVKAACVDLDKAVSKGLLHKNTAARKKSRITKAMNAANA
ncbi:MAG: 30S ribosomal protein S20 [Ruminococcaceae bacterium]|nr:30S ribosomal protein S20 [Oscillospiraceae bacterium]